METTFQVLLVLHIIAGYIALMAGVSAMVSSKGRRVHLLSGNWFYYCMLLVATTAVLLSVIKGGNFLLYIAIFAIYQTWTGYRSIRNKTLRFSAMDWIVVAVAAVNSYFMLTGSIIFLMVFGGINAVLVISDIALQIRLSRGIEVNKMEWLRRHIGHMMGAYTATMTAFLVTMFGSLSFDYQLLVWLGPTILLVPAGVYFTIKYTTRKKSALI